MDNMNTKDWIRTRYSKIESILYLLRVLQITQGLWGFSVAACYLRTYHNLPPQCADKGGVGGHPASSLPGGVASGVDGQGLEVLP